MADFLFNHYWKYGYQQYNVYSLQKRLLNCKSRVRIQQEFFFFILFCIKTAFFDQIKLISNILISINCCAYMYPPLSIGIKFLWCINSLSQQIHQSNKYKYILTNNSERERKRVNTHVHSK
jgi:hypothetical protein